MLNNIDLEKKINSELNTKVSSSKIVHETLNVSIEKDDLKEVLLFLKSNPDMKFKQLIDITAVDYPNKKNIFRMIYLMLSHEFKKRIVYEICLLISLTLVPLLKPPAATIYLPIYLDYLNKQNLKFIFKKTFFKYKKLRFIIPKLWSELCKGLSW